MTDETTTSPDGPPYTTEDVQAARIQEAEAEADALTEFLRGRVRLLNLECRLRDAALAELEAEKADLEAQVARLQAHLDDRLADTGVDDTDPAPAAGPPGGRPNNGE